MKCLREYCKQRHNVLLSYYVACYGRMAEWFEKDLGRIGFLKLFYKGLPLVMALGYVLLVAYVFVCAFFWDRASSEEFWTVILVPSGVFVMLSLLRKMIDRPRPYAVSGGVVPLIAKGRKGESFPSRHSFAAGIIAITFIHCGFVPELMWNGAMCHIWWVICAIMAVLSVFVAITRILAGVHYPTDAAGGLVFGALASLALYMLL